MEYKRLTDRTKTELLEECYNCPYCGIEFLYDCHQKVGNRLAELEDKIENGTLVIVNKPFVVLDYISNGQEYYAIRIAEERDLYINLTTAEAEKRLLDLKGVEK